MWSGIGDKRKGSEDRIGEGRRAIRSHVHFLGTKTLSLEIIQSVCAGPGCGPGPQGAA